MSNTVAATSPPDGAHSNATGWRELWLKEDWWSIWLGLGIVCAGYALFASGSSLKWIAVTPVKWSAFGELTDHFAHNGQRYLAQFVMWSVTFAVALRALGYKARDFIPAFAFLYVLSVLVVALGQWTQANRYNQQASAAQIWWRFPKFVLGFLVASLLVTWATSAYSLAEYNKHVIPNLVAPIKDLRTWAFTFCFLSIGLTMRFRDLARGGGKPFLAFTAGVVINVALGFVLSVWVFAPHWRNL
jgi:hypothetical protein